MILDWTFEEEVPQKQRYYVHYSPLMSFLTPTPIWTAVRVRGVDAVSGKGIFIVGHIDKRLIYDISSPIVTIPHVYYY